MGNHGQKNVLLETGKKASERDWDQWEIANN